MTYTHTIGNTTYEPKTYTTRKVALQFRLGWTELTTVQEHQAGMEMVAIRHTQGWVELKDFTTKQVKKFFIPQATSSANMFELSLMKQFIEECGADSDHVANLINRANNTNQSWHNVYQ